MPAQADPVDVADISQVPMVPSGSAAISRARYGSAGALTRFVPVLELPPAAAGRPIYRCGHCLAPLATPTLRHVRCPHCQRRSAMPEAVWVCCDRCYFEQRVLTASLGSEPRCVSCGQVLNVPDVVLLPLVRRRHHVAAGLYHAHRSGRRDQASLALVVIIAAALLSLKLLSVL